MKSNSEDQDLFPFKRMDMDTLEQLFSGGRPIEVFCYTASKSADKRKHLAIEEDGSNKWWVEHEEHGKLEELSSKLYEVVDLVSDSDGNKAEDTTTSSSRIVVVFALCAANGEFASHMPTGRPRRKRKGHMCIPVDRRPTVLHGKIHSQITHQQSNTSNNGGPLDDAKKRVC